MDYSRWELFPTNLRTTTVEILVHRDMLKFEQVTYAPEWTFVDAAHVISHASHPMSGLK